jgi:hypothetical protein
MGVVEHHSFQIKSRKVGPLEISWEVTSFPKARAAEVGLFESRNIEACAGEIHVSKVSISKRAVYASDARGRRVSE